MGGMGVVVASRAVRHIRRLGDEYDKETGLTERKRGEKEV